MGNGRKYCYKENARGVAFGLAQSSFLPRGTKYAQTCSFCPVSHDAIVARKSQSAVAQYVDERCRQISYERKLRRNSRLCQHVVFDFTASDFESCLPPHHHCIPILQAQVISQSYSSSASSILRLFA
jgi:hypothetical protein